MREENRKLSIFILATVMFLTIGFFYKHRNKKELEANRKYTICYTMGLKGTSSVTYIKYEYFVGEVKYEQLGISKNNVVVKGGRYYVSFLPNNPTINEVQWDIPVPEEVIDVPPDGWDAPPLITPPSMR